MTKKLTFAGNIASHKEEKEWKRQGPSVARQFGTMKRYSSAMENRNWQVWMTLMIGGKSSSELLKEFKKNGFNVSDWARDIMGKPAFTTLPESKEVQLVSVKVRDLGFTKNPTTTELYARAKEMGLDLCPAEVGPHLRLVLTDQLRGDWFWIAMEPISGSDGDSLVLFVYRRDGGGRWLGAHYARPGHLWHWEGEFVFCLRPD